MKKPVFLTLISILCLCISCNKEEEEFFSYDIVGSWELVGFIDDNTGSLESLPDELSFMNILFADNNECGAQSSCNIFTGNYKITGQGEIDIYDLYTTLMLCDEDIMNLEEKYYSGLINANAFYIKEDHLTINTTKDFSMYFIKSEQ